MGMRLLLGSLLFATACSSAYADQVAVPIAPAVVAPRVALAIAPDKMRAPYDVQIITEGGETAPTFALKGRFYVQGNLNQRYIIHVTNPTAHRVEAVVSVDGLDVVDGEAGDLHKRGYIVPAYGDVHIEGFRTSLADVATFRFSSVDGSYAGQKGKARNVGVIAVAIFEETAPPPEQQIIVDAPPPPPPHGPPWRGYPDETASRNKREAPAAKSVAPADAGGLGGGGGVVGGGGAAAGRVAVRPMPPPPPPHDDGRDIDNETFEQPDVAPRTNRPGLGTEFGEQRYSAASYTKFQRAADRPVAIAELRYNDAAGLMALGIPVQPMPDDGEIMTRETADPFPGDHFARPPR
jgi:hypothetical protein